MSTETPHLSIALNEASSLTELVMQIAAAHPVAEARTELARALDTSRFSNLRVHCPSLERDPAESSTCYLAVDIIDSGKTRPALFQWSSAAATTMGRFQNRQLNHRIQTAGGEVELTVYPFASTDRENIRVFAENVAPGFLPRPQRALPAIAAGNRHPEISLPAVFGAFREILGKLKVNMASTVQLSATREMTTDDAIAARHDAVVPSLQEILLAETFVPAGHKGNSAYTSGDESAPCSGAAQRVNHIAVAFARKSGERDRAAQHHDRVVARYIEWNEFSARSGNVGDETAGARHNGNTVAGTGQDAHQLDRAGIRSAHIECRYDDEHRDGRVGVMRARFAFKK